MESSSNAPQKNNQQSGSLRNFNILIAEDYGFMADLMASMLREFGVGKIMMAENGEDAMDLIRFAGAVRGPNDRPIDIVLTDWLMPKMNGVELLDWVRGHDKDSIKFLPVILVSAYTSEKVVTTSRDHGANEAIVKPVSGKVLADRILHVVNNPRPFVKAPGFFGPDRRRREREYEGEEKRIMDLESVSVNHERI